MLTASRILIVEDQETKRVQIEAALREFFPSDQIFSYADSQLSALSSENC